jgi:hypothetical protein
MTLSSLIHKKSKSREIATATAATPATHDDQDWLTVANVASVAVAIHPKMNPRLLHSPEQVFIDEREGETLQGEQFSYEEDDRHHCRQCSNLRGSYCIKQRFRPVDDRPRRCEDFNGYPNEIAPGGDNTAFDMVAKTKPAITCKTCINFESFHAHGGGAGTCKADVMPFGACWWGDTLHSCDEYQSSVNSQADPEPGTDPLLVEVWTPSGTAMTIRADNAEHAEWLRQKNPKPTNPAPKPDPTPEHDADRISEAEHNAQGRFFKYLITRQDGSQFYSYSMPRQTLEETRAQYPEAASVEPVFWKTEKISP